ncbi:hypothetical protein RHSIM_Rhsim03G0158100 [Rhododendron simsii]|uniref:Uncharacterized protein n=1 Tax=Rhododendron simsii TaxID=118357 RepID=A0A834H6D0_RHOSS|nr:hypothetical protein RHSIM_Rhsim03G0158100 [Rhododendron simsii]
MDSDAFLDAVSFQDILLVLTVQAQERLSLIEPVSIVTGGDQPLAPLKTERCSNCSGSGKGMCPTCLCTGMATASEHDPRIDPFDSEFTSSDVHTFQT